MTNIKNQQVGHQVPAEVERFLDRDWYYFRIWVLIFSLFIFSFSAWKKVNTEIATADLIEGKVSKSLATDIAMLYMATTHPSSQTIKNVEYLDFSTISEKNGSRFYQLELNYVQEVNDGSFQPIKEDLFFDDSGWVQAFGSLN